MLTVKNALIPTISRFTDDDWNNLFNWSNNNFLNTSTDLPKVNIKETEHSIFLELAIPGMDKSDFQIDLDNNLLTIRTEKSLSSEQNNEDNYTRKEFCFKSFQRSFSLDNKVVDGDKIKAIYKDGILSIDLPKKEEAKTKPRRLINIS